MNVAAYPVAPIMSLFPEAVARHRFSWFVTPDNPLTGDGGHQLRHAGSSEYWRRVTWAWRNRAYGFSASVLKAVTDGPVYERGDYQVGNHPLHEGTRFLWTAEGFWQFYYVRRTISGRCLRINIGWKLWDHPGRPLFGQYVISINPLMGYTE